MARQPATGMVAWPFLSLTGNLPAPAMVARIGDPADHAACFAALWLLLC